MNKLRYRLVFNRARGQLMAVAETAHADGKAARGAGVAEAAPAARRMGRPRRVTLMLAAAFGAALTLADGALAQVVAERGAPGNQQPTVLSTANGVIQVNLQTPSAAGVSRNTYSQFDVPRGGVILNNSRTNVQSQLGGYVQANPWLSTGPARVILNEVRSNQPSQLNGYIEVAGPRAEVIVANPAGINVAGAGFINVSQATLTTGTPRINGGALDGYSVQRGAISIEGAGLDASGTDFTHLIARSVALNAGVWAQRLTVTTGVNQVGVDNGGANVNAERGDAAGGVAAPPFSIDVSQLGGMYAHKITLLGTEAGVGVRNAGSIGAAAGELIVTTAGRLENSGSLAATGALHLRAQDGLNNSGNLHSDAAIAIASGADVFNSGTVYATDKLSLSAATGLRNHATLSGQNGLHAEAASLDNSGIINSGADAVLALSGDAGNVGGSVQAVRIDLRSATGTIDNSGGQIVQTGGGGFDVVATTLINGAGGKLGLPPAPAGIGGANQTGTGAGTGADADPGATAGPMAGTSVRPMHGDSGGASAASPAPPADPVLKGILHAASIINNGGHISAGGAIDVSVHALDNSAGNVNVDQLAVIGGDLKNRLGSVNVLTNFTAQGAGFGNQGGSVLVGGAFDGQFGGIDNRDGVLQAGHMRLASADALDNTGGVLRQTGATPARLSVGGQLNNALGKIEAAGDLALSAGGITGGGALTTLGDLRLDSGATSTANGNWAVNGSASLRGGAFDNSGGHLSVAKDLSLAAAALNNVAGTISAGANLTLGAAGALDNRRGHLQAETDLTVTVAGTLNNDGGAVETRAAGSAMQVQAQAIDNGSGRIVNVGQADTLIASAGALANTGTLAGNGKLRIDATTMQNHTGGQVLAVGQLDLNVAQQLDNLGGTISSGGTLNVTQASAGLRNSGKISAGDRITLHTGALNNDGGRITTADHAGADLLLRADSMSNKGGAIWSARDLAIATGANLNNDGGTVQAGRDLTMASHSLSNVGGVIEAIGDASALTVHADRIATTGRIVNVGTGATEIAGASAIVNSGVMAGNGGLLVNTRALLNQAAGSIVAGQAMELGVQQQLTNHGQVSSAGTLRFDQGAATFTNSGKVVAGASSSLRAASIVNDGGQIATAGGSGADLAIAAGSLRNHGGSIVADRDADLVMIGALDNTGGTLQANRNLSVSAGGALSNDAGKIEAIHAASALTVQAGAIVNGGGRIVNVGTGSTSVASAGELSNNGLIAGNGNLMLAAQTLRNLAAGSVVAGKALELGVRQQLVNQGKISSTGTLRFDQAAASFINNGQVVTGAAASIRAGSIVNDGGQIATTARSGADLSLSAHSLSNRGGGIFADRDAALAIAGTANNASGTIQAARNLQILAAGALTNDGGVIETGAGAGNATTNTANASTLTLQAASITNNRGNNGGGSIVNVGTGATTVASAGDISSSGQIAGNGNLFLSAQTLNNQPAGSIAAGQALELGVRGLLTNQGKISSTGTLRFEQAAAGLLNSGKVVAGATSSIRVGSVINDGGQIATVTGSGADLALSADTVSNRGGGMFADRDVRLRAGAGLNNAGGTMQAARDMQLSAGGALNNDAGVIEAVDAASKLHIEVAHLSNMGGRIVNVGTNLTSVTSAGDLSSSGKIAANGDLTLNAQTLHQQTAGAIVAGKALELGVLQQLTNQGSISSGSVLHFDQSAAGLSNSGKIVAGAAVTINAANIVNDGGQIATVTGSGGNVSLSARGLSNHGGSISADGNASLIVTGAVNNATGTVQAGKNLQLSALGALSNDGGVIEAVNAASSLTVQAAAITNGAGRIVKLGTGATGVSSVGDLASSGQIAGNGDVTISAQTLHNLAAGSIVAGKAMELSVLRQVTNQGSISSGAALHVDQAAVNFVNSGKVVAGSAVSIHAANIVNDGGQIATVAGSAADVALSAHSLSNRGGGIFADRDASVSSGTGIDNAAGTIQAGQRLTVSAGGALGNDGGVMEAIQAAGTLTVQAAAISNLGGRIVNVGTGVTSVSSSGDIVSSGKIAGNGDLTLNAQTLHHQSAGSIIAGKALELGVWRQLSNEGSISSAGALRFNQAGAAFANSGKVVAGATSSVHVATIVNDGGQIATATVSAADLMLSAHSLSNRGGGIVADRNAILVIDGAVDNTGGTVQAGTNLQLSAGGILRNDGGVIEAANAASTFTLQAAAIANVGGRIVNVGGGATNVTSQSSVANSGVIAGNGALNLTAQSLHNTLGGTIVAGQALELGVSQQLANLGGTISSGGTLRFHQAAASFSNSGQVLAGGNVSIVAGQFDNNAGQLATTAGSGAGIALAAQTLSNRSGRIAADGDTALTSAGALDNTQGTLHAGANLALTAGGALSNDGGLIEASGAASTLALQGQSVDNGNGRIHNVGNGASGIVSQSGIVNHGAIATNGKLVLQGLTLQNGAGGSIAAGSDLDLLLTQQLSNQGSINSNGTLRFNQTGAVLVNRGQIISGGNATLNAYRIDNQGGNIATGQGSGAALTLNTQVLNNQGGTLAADGDLNVATQTLDAAGAMSAGRDLSLTTAGDYTHSADSHLHANRNLSLSAGGTLTNTGKLEAAGQLALTAGQVSNQAGALIQGHGVAIATSGMLGNAGEILGADTLRIAAAGVNNSNSMVGGALSITAETLNNSGPAALLGATDDMGLWLSKELNNTAGATIYSAGAIAIAANQARDANGDLVNHTGTVNNLSSTIEAAGDLELTAGTVNNIREGVAVHKVKTVDETTTMTMPSWWSLNAGDAGGNHHQFLTTSSNYQAYEVYFVNPADILEQSTVVTPDGNVLTRVVLRTHANDSVFYSALGSYAGAYGKRARITASEGTKVLYYTERQDGQRNPDQGGTLQDVSNYAQVTDWSASTLTLSNQYGSCVTNCVRLVSQLDYNDPAHTILRATELVLPGSHDTDGYELIRTAHHTAVDEQLAPGAGAVAKILSGGNMRVVLGQTLNNRYGDIMAGGAYMSTGGDTNNTGTTLYRTHSFDGVRQYANAPSNTYTAADISEQIGQIRGVISGGQGVYISGRSFNNVDASAGTVGNVRAGFTVLGDAYHGAAAIGAQSGIGGNSAAVAAGVTGSGKASAAAATGKVSGSGNDSQVAGADGVGGSGATNAGDATGAASGSGHASDASAAEHADGSGNTGARTLAGNASVTGRRGADAVNGVRLGDLNSANGPGTAHAAQGWRAADVGQAGGAAGVIKIAPNGLSKHNPDPSGHYLFETRPQFANLADWIGSDYLLRALNMNPDATQKRLGDAFYEQKLVREQLAELTGRAIGGGASDDTYQQLMRSAVSYAQAWQLRPGIALTAEQVAQLTSDIVWLESQRVSLPDGSVQNVLVPKVYLAHVAGGSVKQNGALVTGDSVVVNVEHLLNRGGAIDGGNRSGTGRTVLVTANDLVNQGGAIKGNEVMLQAGRDLINQTVTATQTYAKADNHGSYTAVANQASITASGALSASAGRDVHDVGGQINAGGSAALTAGRDMSFTTARTGSSFAQIKGSISLIDSSAGNQRAEHRHRLVAQRRARPDAVRHPGRHRHQRPRRRLAAGRPRAHRRRGAQRQQ